jgi:hypothetical protein
VHNIKTDYKNERETIHKLRHPNLISFEERERERERERESKSGCR